MAQKLKTFEVEVQETSYGWVRVTAESRADATEKAYEALSEGAVMWGGKVNHQIGEVREVVPVKVVNPRKVRRRCAR